MSDKKKPNQSLILAVLGLVFFPIKITVVYFINCAKDVSRAVGHEIQINFRSTNDKRWGR